VERAKLGIGIRVIVQIDVGERNVMVGRSGLWLGRRALLAISDPISWCFKALELIYLHTDTQARCMTALRHRTEKDHLYP
jgi:hypothetical protein